MGDMTEPVTADKHTGKAGVEHAREHCRPRWCGEFPPEGHPLAATPRERELLAAGKDPVDVYRGGYAEPIDHVGTSGKPHPLTRCRPDFCGQQPSSGTWGAPILESGLDQFTGHQEPNPKPVDDLSRFVLDRIRFAEAEPAADMVPKFYSQPAGAMAHRYAGHVRRDMVAFRRIVAEYCTELAEQTAAFPDHGVEAFARAMGLRYAVVALANRWSDHPDFVPEWRRE